MHLFNKYLLDTYLVSEDGRVPAGCEPSLNFHQEGSSFPTYSLPSSQFSSCMWTRVYFLNLLESRLFSSCNLILTSQVPHTYCVKMSL